MKRLQSILSKIWFPAVLVGVMAVQTFGMDIARNGIVELPWAIITEEAVYEADTVIYENRIFTKFRDQYEKLTISDTLGLDSLGADSTQVFISARDTMKVPDSLKYTDPFRYKYYVAIKDSLTHVIVRDSLKNAGDSLDWPKLDSLYRLDSIETAIRKFNAWYASLDKAERKKYDFEQKMKARQAYMDSVLDAKDSLLAIRDSIRENTPRILETFAVPDSMFYKRIITWNKGRSFNDVRLHDLDTSYNYYFNDYPFMRNNVNVSYLGISGSAVQPFDFANRTSDEGVSFYTPYECYTYSPYTLPFYNTKTPYTELAYWGTLFANAERAENELHIMTTQNILPSWNFALEYDRYGANGMLENEDVDNRTCVISTNYMGKRYLMHAGYIYNKMSKGENGGIIDNFWIRDTTVGSREIDVRLKDASTLIKKNTLFLDQTYRIPFNFINNIKEKKVLKKEYAYRDSILATGDSLAINEMEELLQTRAEERAEAAKIDTLNTDITTAFIGHTSEYSVYRKIYEDKIELSDTNARKLYNNNFYLNPTSTYDSLRVMKFENKVFIKLQPWSSDAIVSAINVGIGDRLMNYYMFPKNGYLFNRKGNTVWNSAYIYGGAKGQYKKYFNWDAEGYYTFLGKEVNDVGISANASFSLYPFRRHRKSPMTLSAHFETSLDEPEYYQQHYYSNHYAWDNDFDKISKTQVVGMFDVPHWKLNLTAGWTLMKNYVYYDGNAIPQQEKSAVSVLKFALNKNFKLAGIHLDNQILFQISSDEDVIPVPPLAINSRLYWQFNVVKNVMQVQLGAHVTYNTKWYAPGYSPALGMFYNQKEEKYGNCPYFDVFANVQWKRACIFVKFLNAGMGWPMDKADYFSAHGYIRPQRGLKLGVFWPFYMQPARNKSVGGAAGSAGGSGGRSGSGGGLGGAMSGFGGSGGMSSGGGFRGM
ncbi:MAG: putative porin [Candidatus Cryptobacteroides sp.]